MCLSPQRKSGHEFCVQHTDPYSTALLHQPTSSLPAPSSLAVNLSFFTQTQAASFFFFYQWAWLAAGCLQREKCARVSEKDRTSPWISAAGSHTNQENVCVCACLCACVLVLCLVLHCMSCGGPCLATNSIWQQELDAMRPLLQPPSPIRAEPCIKGHYITVSTLFHVFVTHWDCARWSVRGSEVKLLSFFFLPVSVSASPPADQAHKSFSLSSVHYWNDILQVYKLAKHTWM